MPPPAMTHPAPASLTVARQDGKPLEASDLAALRAAVACHDLEHAAPILPRHGRGVYYCDLGGDAFGR